MNFKKSLLLPTPLFFKSPIIINFFTYCLGAIFIRGISFFILPLIMHRIPPSQYGILSLLTAFIAIATAIIGLGLRQVVSIEYFHTDNNGRHTLIQDIIIIYTLIACPIIIMLWYAHTFIIRCCFFNHINTLQFLGTLCSIFLFFYSELMYQLLQYEQAAKRLILLQGTLASFIAGATLYTVFYLNAGITGIIWSQTSGTIVAASFALIYLRHYHASLSMPRLPATLYYVKYGFPFIPGILASWILSSADRWILGYFMTMYDVGIYAVADLISQLFYVIVLQSWAGSYLPHIMQQYQNHPHQIQEIETTNHRIMWITMLGLILIISCGYPLAYVVLPQLLPPSYLQAMRYIWILLMGQIFLLGSYFVAALIQYTKHTYFLAGALFVPALINIILNFLFIPWWGIMGCSVATLISYSIYFMITYAYNKKLIKTY